MDTRERTIWQAVCLRVWTACCCAALLMGPAHAVEWIVPTGYPAGNFHTENLQRFADDLAAATSGAVTMKLHPNGSLYKMSEIPQAVRTGKVHGGEVMLSSMSSEIPVAGIDSVPFIVNGYQQAKRLWSESRPQLEAAFAQRGYVLLYAVPWPPQGLYTKKTITHATQFRAMRMRTYNAATERIAQLVGAEPVLLQTSELTAALEAGRIDTLVTSSATAIDLAPLWKWFPYYYDVSAWLPKNAVFVRKAAFDELDQKTQQTIRRLAGEAEARGWSVSEQKAEDYNRRLAEKGTKILPPDPALSGDFRRLGEKLAREWLRASGSDGLSVLLRYELARFRTDADPLPQTTTAPVSLK